MSQFFLSDWAQVLQQSRYKGLVLTLLEGSGPLRLILSQFMLAGTPFVDPTKSDQWKAAAEMLEDDSQCHKLAAILREESSL